MALALLVGCSTSRVEVVRDEYAPAPVGAGEATLTILGRRDATRPEPEDDFLECLGEEVLDGESALRVLPEQAFLDALFPWFEPRAAPGVVEDLKPLLERPIVLERIRETGVRYVVWVQGRTETTDGGGAVSCAAGPGGGGCFGFAWWDKDSSYELTVWDLQRAASVGSVNVEAVGTSYLPAVVIPVPLIARTQSTACDGLSEQLLQLLRPTPLAP